ncbi:uncharacterized protein PG986_002652 [Apiospora aurea]|uniref:Rhodopsin domain-containing protein n=1 Tax=Apiospora aurea TaxID=335848 RepID=A0ABR1QQB7_9PEZI
MVYVFPIERDSQKAILGGAVVFSLLPTTAVVLRLVARSRLQDRKLGLSDWLIVFGMFACAVVGGMGYHMSEIMVVPEAGPDSVTLLMKLVTVVVIFWSLSLGLTKLSILALCTKIFSIGSFVLITQACAVFVVPWSAVLFIGAFTICTPGRVQLGRVLVVMLLPMPYLYGLSRQLTRRLKLMVTFGIGLAVCILSAVRLADIVKIDMTDFPFSGGVAPMFSALEPCLLTSLSFWKLAAK